MKKAVLEAMEKKAEIRLTELNVGHLNVLTSMMKN